MQQKIESNHEHLLRASHGGSRQVEALSDNLIVGCWLVDERTRQEEDTAFV